MCDINLFRSYYIISARSMCFFRVKCQDSCILQDKQFHLQLKSEQKEIIQNVVERKDSMAVLLTGFGKSMCYVPPSHFGQGKIIYANHLP